MEWSKALNSLAGETTSLEAIATTAVTPTIATPKDGDLDEAAATVGPPSFRSEYTSFANYYINTFYCLAIICMVSVLDR